jgi:hypothetical protein
LQETFTADTLGVHADSLQKTTTPAGLTAAAADEGRDEVGEMEMTSGRVLVMSTTSPETDT